MPPTSSGAASARCAQRRPVAFLSRRQFRAALRRRSAARARRRGARPRIPSRLQGSRSRSGSRCGRCCASTSRQPSARARRPDSSARKGAGEHTTRRCVDRPMPTRDVRTGAPPTTIADIRLGRPRAPRLPRQGRERVAASSASADLPPTAVHSASAPADASTPGGDVPTTRRPAPARATPRRARRVARHVGCERSLTGPRLLRSGGHRAARSQFEATCSVSPGTATAIRRARRSCIANTPIGTPSATTTASPSAICGPPNPKPATPATVIDHGSRHVAALRLVEAAS